MSDGDHLNIDEVIDGLDFAVVPKEPTDGLLAAMALRLHHDFGIRPKAEQDTIMCFMRQIHEEVIGKGFYSPDAEDKFKRAIKS